MGDAFDEVYGTEPKDAFDEVYGTAPAAAPKDAFDEVYAAPAAPGEDIGRLAGSILARANEGSVTQTPASWGDVFSSAGKV